MGLELGAPLPPAGQCRFCSQITPWQKASTRSSWAPWGKPSSFALQGVVAIAEGQLTCLQQWGDGMGAAELAATGPHSDQSRNLALQQLTDRRAIGAVLDQHRILAPSLLTQIVQGPDNASRAVPVRM